MSAVELKKLEFGEREKEQECQLHLKELEFNKCELDMQLKIRELELAAASPTLPSRHTEFNVSKQICFVPSFQVAEVVLIARNHLKKSSQFCSPPLA